ncbi:MAG: hypothetical protein A3K30_04595 [Deltaproteobacteria bacterium RBG_13_51_10]|nr:MAG: hypothetical protein A3K30_04595 [Deltaproteobacteria bacterium RBG_13_51_10]
MLIPARHNLEIYQDVVSLAEGGLLSFQPWVPQAPDRPPLPLHQTEHIRQREETRQRTQARRKAKLPLKRRSQPPPPWFAPRSLWSQN